MSELPRAPGALVNAGFWPRRFSTGAGSDIRRRPAVLQQRQVGVLARHPVFCLMSWRLNTPRWLHSQVLGELKHVLPVHHPRPHLRRPGGET